MDNFTHFNEEECEKNVFNNDLLETHEQTTPTDNLVMDMTTPFRNESTSPMNQEDYIDIEIEESDNDVTFITEIPQASRCLSNEVDKNIDNKYNKNSVYNIKDLNKKDCNSKINVKDVSKFHSQNEINNDLIYVISSESDDELVGKNNANNKGVAKRNNSESNIKKRRRLPNPNKGTNKSSSGSDVEISKKPKIDAKLARKTIQGSRSKSKKLGSPLDNEIIEYSCQWKNCKLSFRNDDLLIKHMKQHYNENEKFFYCLWDSCLTNSNALVPPPIENKEFFSHMISHIQTKQYYCQDNNCTNKIFTNKKELENHIKNCHNIKESFLCRDKLCAATFTTSKARLVHEKKIHGKGDMFIFSCPFVGCSKAFPDNSSVHRHVRLTHGAEGLFLVDCLKHKCSSEKQTNKILGLVTNRIAQYVKEQINKVESVDIGEPKNFLQYYDCLDICVHKEYNTRKNVIENLTTDINRDKKLRQHIQKEIDNYRKKEDNDLKDFITIKDSLICNLSIEIFRNLNIIKYPVLPSSKNDFSVLREAEVQIASKYIFKRFMDDEKLKEKKEFWLPHDIETLEYNVMPDQLTDADKCKKDKFFIEDEFFFGIPNNLIVEEKKVSCISGVLSFTGRNIQDKFKNGVNSPSLKLHESNDFCPAYFMRIIQDFKKYLNKGNDRLKYKNKLKVHTIPAEDYIKSSDTSMRKTIGKMNSLTIGKGNNKKSKKTQLCTVIDGGDSDGKNDMDIADD